MSTELNISAKDIREAIRKRESQQSVELGELLLKEINLVDFSSMYLYRKSGNTNGDYVVFKSTTNVFKAYDKFRESFRNKSEREEYERFLFRNKQIELKLESYSDGYDTTYELYLVLLDMDYKKDS